MNAVAAPRYVVDAADPIRDREQMLAVWRGNLGTDARMAAKLAWFYAEGPCGAPLTALLRSGEGGPVVGVASAGPRHLRVGDRDLRAGLLVDLAVAPEHRTLGPALLLQQGLIELARARFDLLYGLPNSRAVPVFKRIGYTKAGEMLRLVRVLRHREFLARRLPRPAAAVAAVPLDGMRRARDAWRRRGFAAPSATWSPSPPPDPACARVDGLLAGVRDAAFFAWRFSPQASAPTRWLTLDSPRSPRPTAWFAVQDLGATLRVVDAGGAPEQAWPDRAAVLALLQAADAAGHAAVSVQLAAPPEAMAPWLESGFVSREAQPVFARWLHGDNPCSGVLMTAADEDE